MRHWSQNVVGKEHFEVMFKTFSVGELLNRRLNSCSSFIILQYLLIMDVDNSRLMAQVWFGLRIGTSAAACCSSELS